MSQVSPGQPPAPAPKINPQIVTPHNAWHRVMGAGGGMSRWTIFTLMVLLAGIFISGCAWTYPPSKSEAIIAPWTVTGATEKTDAGELFLTDSGLWAFVPGPQAKKSSPINPEAFVSGELVGFLPRATGAQAVSHAQSAHIFGVVHVESWGVMLQRLDSQPVKNVALRGELAPIYKGAALANLGICRGSGDDIFENACLNSARQSGSEIVWRIYETDEAGHLHHGDATQTGRTMPIQTAGMLADGRLIHQVPGDKAASAMHWVAIPAYQQRDARPPRAPTLAHARVLLGEGCPSFELSTGFQPIEVLSEAQHKMSHQRPNDPVDTEMAAILAGVDALVRCDGEQVEIDVPGLYRPLMRVAGTELRAPPFAAMRPIRGLNLAGSADSGANKQEISKNQAISAKILLGAALGTGAWAAADFYLEQALAAMSDNKENRQFALDMMQVFAAAGRPELAIRAGAPSIKGAWHQQNDPSFMVGQTWALAALGDVRAQNRGLKRIQTLAAKPINAQLQTWFAWSAIRSDHARTNQADGRDARGAMSFLEQAQMWRLLYAANLVVAPELQVSIDLAPDLRKELSPLDMLFEPVDQSTAAQLCASHDDCMLDVYGRSIAARLDAAADAQSTEVWQQLVDDVLSTAPALVAPGFEDMVDLDKTRLSTTPGTTRMALIAALMPLMPTSEYEAIYQQFIQASAQAVREEGVCLTVPSAQRILARLGGQPRPKMRAEFKYQRVRLATRWLLSEALVQACDSPADIAESLATYLGADANLTRSTLPLLLAISDQVPADARAVLLDQLASFSTEYRLGEDCERLNLALALSRAKAGQLDAARESLAQSVNCSDGSPASFEESRQVIHGFIQFETTGKLPADLRPSAHNKLSQLIHHTRHQKTENNTKNAQIPQKNRDDAGNQILSANTCAGLRSPTYQLSGYIDPEIAALAITLPTPETGDLMLETSSQALERALSSLQAARRFLAEARPGPAAEALMDARRTFERLGHQVGLRRVAFLEKVVFEAKIERFLPDESNLPNVTIGNHPTQTEAKKPSIPTQTPPKQPDKGLQTPNLARFEQLSTQQWALALRRGLADRIVEQLRTHDGELTTAQSDAYWAALLLVHDVDAGLAELEENSATSTSKSSEALELFCR